MVFTRPTTKEASEILKLCGRALLFGDKTTTDRYAGDSRIEIHGPGFSKILIGEDEIERWPEYLDLMVESIAQNGGRSCINASAIVVPARADEIADGLAKRLGPVEPRPIDDESAMLAGFANPKMAEFINAAIDDGLQTSGAEDVTAKYRRGPRLVALKARFTCVRRLCAATRLRTRWPIANTFSRTPASSRCRRQRWSNRSDRLWSSPRSPATSALIEQLIESPLIERLNLGPLSTMKISWDQPHEGNLFEFLYKRRAIERV